MKKIEIGPVTRIEGHLNVKTGIENNIIVDAQCESEMFRGFEVILQGRDPLDAQQITQRICGVCPYAHAIASSYAQESAYQTDAPRNGRILHNLVQVPITCLIICFISISFPHLTSRELADQAEQLQETVAFFRIGD